MRPIIQAPLANLLVGRRKGGIISIDDGSSNNGSASLGGGGIKNFKVRRLWGCCKSSGVLRRATAHPVLYGRGELADLTIRDIPHHPVQPRSLQELAPVQGVL